MKERATELCEAGVHYFRIRYPHIEEPPFRAQRVEYTSVHVPSGKRFRGHVFLSRVEEIRILCNFWQSKTWHYEPCPN